MVAPLLSSSLCFLLIVVLLEVCQTAVLGLPNPSSLNEVNGLQSSAPNEGEAPLEPLYSLGRRKRSPEAENGLSSTSGYVGPGSLPLTIASERAKRSPEDDEAKESGDEDKGPTGLVETSVEEGGTIAKGATKDLFGFLGSVTGRNKRSADANDGSTEKRVSATGKEEAKDPFAFIRSAIGRKRRSVAGLAEGTEKEATEEDPFAFLRSAINRDKRSPSDVTLAEGEDNLEDQGSETGELTRVKRTKKKKKKKGGGGGCGCCCCCCCGKKKKK